MKRYQAIIISVGATMLFAVLGSFAQAQTIVECDLCNFCDVFITTHNLFNLIALQLTAPLAVLMFIVGGLILMFGGSSPTLLQRAKTILRFTLYGVLIVLLSWVIVNTTINVITNSNSTAGGGFWPWDSPQCYSTGAGNIEDSFFCDTCGPNLSDVFVGTICTTPGGEQGTCKSTGSGGANNICGCQ